MPEFDVDVAIFGSGFGGSILALLLNEIGLESVVLDRAEHPRFSVGESSTPTGNIILQALAERYEQPRLQPLTAHGPWCETYPHVTNGSKRGFSYFKHRSGEPFSPDPDHANELLVAASSDPYYSDTQWLRSDVDAFLAEEVRARGTPLLGNTEVTGIDGGERWMVQAFRGGDEVQCRADFLVDATGGGQLLPSLGFTKQNPSLRTRSRALYTHFSGLPRWRDWMANRGGQMKDHPYPCDEAVVHHVLEDGWLWEIRFDNDRVSAGLVLNGDPHTQAELPPREEWAHHLRDYPTLTRRFSDAEIVDPPGRIVRTGPLQRFVDPAAGPGWALLPFTAGFVDPLHSTGIAHTLSGVERLIRLFERYGTSPPPNSLRDYSHSIHRELRFVDELVSLCYDALPSFRGWTISTMVYFAAATTYERRRTETDDVPDEPPSFLCSDDERMWAAVRCARQAMPRNRNVTAETLRNYEAIVKDAIQPFNEVGLLNPPISNMYPHTAAPTTA